MTMGSEKSPGTHQFDRGIQRETKGKGSNSGSSDNTLNPWQAGLFCYRETLSVVSPKKTNIYATHRLQSNKLYEIQIIAPHSSLAVSKKKLWCSQTVQS